MPSVWFSPKFYHVVKSYPFPKQKNLDSSKLKEFGDNFEFHENGRKLSKWEENTEGKGEIACYDLYCRHVQCFSQDAPLRDSRK